MNKPARTDDPTALLCVASSMWWEALAHSLPHEGLELLHRALADPDLELAARIQFKAGTLTLEVSDGSRKTDLARIDVEPLRPADGFGHQAEGTLQ
jgi:hypothetical protein